jgi:hypothetical protein
VSDALVGYRQSMAAIDDPEVVRTSGADQAIPGHNRLVLRCVLFSRAQLAQFRLAAGEAMNASADLQLALASSTCGFKQVDMLPNVAWGQNCRISLAHSLAVQEAFDRIVEQPTDSSPTCKCKQPKTRPPPGMTRAHSDQTSAVQFRSEVNSASCAATRQEPASSNVALSATA